MINRIKILSLFSQAWIQYRKGIPLFENLGHLIRKRFPYCEKFTFAIFFGFLFSFSIFSHDVPVSALLCCLPNDKRGRGFLFHVIKCHLPEVHGEGRE